MKNKEIPIWYDYGYYSGNQTKENLNDRINSINHNHCGYRIAHCIVALYFLAKKQNQRLLEQGYESKSTIEKLESEISGYRKQVTQRDEKVE